MWLLDMLNGFLYLTAITASNPLNETLLSSEEDDDLTESDVEEFKERVRRLIPYMMYYVVNNGVSQEYKPISEVETPAAPLRKQQYYLIQRENLPENAASKLINKQPNPPKKLDYKFVPSIQYNPKDVGPDNDHFTPIRYGAKLPYNYVPFNYKTYDSHDKANPQKDKYGSARPLRVYGLPEPERERNYLRIKSPVKAIPGSLQAEFVPSLDYLERPVEKVNKDAITTAFDYGHALDVNFEPHRYIGSDYSRPPKPVTARKPASQISHRFNLPNANHILKSLHLTNRLPEKLNQQNLDSSIKTLVEILDILNNGPTRNDVRDSFPLTPIPKYNEFVARYEKPHVITETRYEATPKPSKEEVSQHKLQHHYKPYEIKERPKLFEPVHGPNYDDKNDKEVVQYYVPIVQDIELDDDYKSVDYDAKRPPERPPTATDFKQAEDYSYDIKPTNEDALEDDAFGLPLPHEEPATPSPEHPKQTVDSPGLTQGVVLPPPSFKYGATRGKPHVDYPAYSSIPETSFNCKKQRYKGFFGDPATGCQVWHYCDLNGGKSSFLCPNGTIFSQIALTCDWWFNVKCESTTQLYVLNERLYKYILPIMPKFPEDFTGPEVDRYLEFKFKEMEEKLKEKKLKKQQEKATKGQPQISDNKT